MLFLAVGDERSDAEVDRSVSEAGDVASVPGTESDESTLPVTTSQSQSPMPPGTMSTAVWGE